MAIKFEAISDFDRVVADYERIQRANARLEGKVEQLSNAIRRQERTSSSGFDRMAAGIRSTITAYVGFDRAIALVNEGLAEQNRLAEQANRVQLTAADAQAEVIKNLGGASVAQAAAFIGDVQGIARAGGAPEAAPVLEAAAATLSGTGGNQELTKRILAEAVPLFRNKLAELPDFAGAVADLATITGADTAEEIRRTVGLVLSTQGQARIQSLDAFKNVAPALAAVATTDTSGDFTRALAEGGAAFAAVGSAIKDPLGAQTKTAVSKLAANLAELFPTEDLQVLEGGELKTIGGTGLRTLGERIQAAQARAQTDARFRAEVASLSFGEGASNQVVRSMLLDPKSEAARRFRDALPAIRPDAALVEQIRTTLETATPQLARAAVQRQAAGGIEAFQRESAIGRRAAARTIAAGTLEQTRPGFFGFLGDRASLSAIDAAAGIVGPEAAAGVALGARERELRSIGGTGLGALLSGFPGGGFLQNVPIPESMQSEATREQLQLLREQRDLLRRMADREKTAGAGESTVAAAALNQQREGR